MAHSRQFYLARIQRAQRHMNDARSDAEYDAARELLLSCQRALAVFDMQRLVSA